MHLYACRGALAKGSTISIVGDRNGEVAGEVYGKNVIALLEEEKRKIMIAGRLREDNANFEKRGFAATSSRTFSNKWLQGMGSFGGSTETRKKQKRMRKRGKCAR